MFVCTHCFVLTVKVHCTWPPTLSDCWLLYVNVVRPKGTVALVVAASICSSSWKSCRVSSEANDGCKRTRKQASRECVSVRMHVFVCEGGGDDTE